MNMSIFVITILNYCVYSCNPCFVIAYHVLELHRIIFYIVLYRFDQRSDLCTGKALNPTL